MIVYKGRLLKKSSNLQIEARPVKAGHCVAFKHHISLVTDLAAYFGCDRFRIMPDIVSKLLRDVIWSRCALRFESEQTLFPWTGGRFRSAALRRILFGTCDFVPISYFYSETNDRSKDWAKKWVRLWSATTSRQFIENLILHEKKWLVSARYLQSIKPFWLLKWVSIARVVACFPQASRSWPAATAANSETLCVCARPSDPPKQCRRAAPRAWPLILPSKHIRLPSGTAFGEIA